MLSDMAPVFSPVAEASVIHAVLYIPAARVRCFERLSPVDFHHPAHRAAFGLLQRTWQANCRFDDPATAEQIHSQRDVMASIQAMPPDQMVWGAALTTLVELSQRRRLQRSAAEAAVLAADLARPITEVREQAMALSDAAVDHRTGIDFLSNAEILRRVLEQQEQARQGKLARTPWCLHPKLDAAMLTPGSLTVVGARPGVGKTAFVVSATLAQAEAAIPTGFICFEMSHVEVMTRYLSQLTGITFQRIAEGFPGNMERDERDRYQDACDYMATARIHLFCEKLLDLAAVSDLATEWRRRAGIRVLYVDYAQLLARFIKGREPLREKVGYVSAFLKYKVAQPLNLPVVLLAQVGRDAAGRQPTMQDLKESGNLEEDAHNIILIDRPHAANQPGKHTYSMNGTPLDMRDKAALLIDKARNSPTRRVFLRFHAETARFEPLGEYSDDVTGLAKLPLARRPGIVSHGEE